MRWFFSDPPPPPPPPPPESWFAIVFAALCILWGYFILHRKLTINQQTVLWLPPGAILAMVTGRLSMKDVIIPGAAQLVPSIPVTAFSLLLISELLAFKFNGLSHKINTRHFRIPAMTVHTVSLMYYLWEPVRCTCPSLRDWATNVLPFATRVQNIPGASSGIFMIVLCPSRGACLPTPS
jgi:hypothetical protein